MLAAVPFWQTCTFWLLLLVFFAGGLSALGALGLWLKFDLWRERRREEREASLPDQFYWGHE